MFEPGQTFSSLETLTAAVGVYEATTKAIMNRTVEKAGPKSKSNVRFHCQRYGLPRIHQARVQEAQLNAVNNDNDR